MTGTTPIDVIIQGDCLEEMKKLPDISRNSRREQAKIFCVEEILPDALDEIERLRASLIDLHAEYINTLEKNPECSAWDLDEQSDADQRRLRRNAAHAISIVEPPIYLQADQQAAYIKELESSLDEAEALTKKNAELMNGYLGRIKVLEKNCIYDPGDGKIFVPDGHPEIERLRARVVALEDALAEYQRLGKIISESVIPCLTVHGNCDQCRPKTKAACEAIAAIHKGKIGPDAATVDQTPNSAENSQKTGPNSPKMAVWQITEERKAAIDRGLQFLEWSYAKNSAHDTKEQIAVLWAMLDEVGQEIKNIKTAEI